MANRSLPPAVQRDAGFSLARTGWAPNDLDAWIQIPAGEFLYGDEKEKQIIETMFAIQKYPVTNLQFKRFMDDGGYEQQEFWVRMAGNGAWKTESTNYYFRHPLTAKRRTLLLLA
ncbi:MAG: SUMF1/EgtB/PvdO family nonheme iron enzyme [Anaerolineales bacterium]|nr:SUMF1/EgtB/PvdO family nonheme iron enzyme [Anaerolineales bacterium]